MNERIVIIDGDRFEKIMSKLDNIAHGITGSPASWLSSSQVCELLGISTKTLSNYRERGIIPFHKIGRNVRFKKSDIENLMEANKIENV